VIVLSSKLINKVFRHQAVEISHLGITNREISPAQPTKKKSKDNTLACRYELKYRIPEFKARGIAAFIKPYLHIDKYSLSQPTGQYPISSLYFDSKNLSLFRETTEGKKNRFKLRLRTYSDDQKAPYFIEVKRRINNVIIKGRARIAREDFSSVMSGGLAPSNKYREDENLIRQFQLYKDSINAIPIVQVRYMRQAFEGDTPHRVRVTFDRQLHYKTTRDPQVNVYGPGWHRIAINFVILEIKFTERFPAWLTQMVRCYDLKQGGFSKYVSSVKQSHSMGFSAPEVLV